MPSESDVIDVHSIVQEIKNRASQHQKIKKKWYCKYSIKKIFAYLSYIYKYLITPKETQCSIDDLASFDDILFIQNAYRTILEREADDNGLKHNIKILRSGSYTKIDIISRLTFSAENSYTVKIRGIFFHMLINIIYKTPFIGYMLSIGTSILRLPRLIKKIQQFQFNTSENMGNILTQIQEQQARLHELIAEISLYTESINNLKADNKKNIQRINDLESLTDIYIKRINNLEFFANTHVKNINQKLTDFNIHHFDTEYIMNNILSRLYAIEEPDSVKKDTTSNKNQKMFYSQFGEDKWLVENNITPKKGIFVDIGAGDGKIGSNTYYFEKIGWQGICIEPHPDNFKKASKIRKIVLGNAVSSKEGETEFLLSSVMPDLSGLQIKDKKAKKIKVQCLRLDTILEKNNIKSIDLISIDTEGTELDVWNSFDFKKYKPKIVIIEFNSDQISNEKVYQHFYKLPYKLIHRTKANYIYKYEK